MDRRPGQRRRSNDAADWSRRPRPGLRRHGGRAQPSKYGECGTRRGVAAGLDRAGLGEVTSRRQRSRSRTSASTLLARHTTTRDDRRHPERDETDPGPIQVDAAVLRGEKGQRARPNGRHRRSRGPRVGQPARDCHRHAERLRRRSRHRRRSRAAVRHGDWRTDAGMLRNGSRSAIEGRLAAREPEPRERTRPGARSRRARGGPRVETGRPGAQSRTQACKRCWPSTPGTPIQRSGAFAVVFYRPLGRPSRPAINVVGLTEAVLAERRRRRWRGRRRGAAGSTERMATGSGQHQGAARSRWSDMARPLPAAHTAGNIR